MSNLSVREFLRTSSMSEDEDTLHTVSSLFNAGSRKDSQWLLRRHDTIFDHEYRYRSDHCVYPGVRPHYVNVNHLIVMVGLPARGKTYIARKLCRYLNWGGMSTKVISVSEYRRKAAGVDLNHDFFKSGNLEAEKIREQAYVDALKDGAAWLQEKREHKIIILDGTNGTKARRKLVDEFCEENRLKPFFIESICDDEEIILEYIKELHIYSPDYVNFDQNAKMEDFEKRLKHYEDCYEEISEKCEFERCFSYIKVINGGKQYLVNLIDGYLQSHVVYFLMNIHMQKRSLYITVHGECEYNVEKEVGGRTGLTETGKTYAKALQDYVEKENITNLKIWPSSMIGCKETADYIQGQKEVWRALDYLDCGECHGMKFSELSQKFPGIFSNSKGPLDLHWRYPGGESYQDMLSRLEPVIIELERERNVLVISHRTTVRCLMAYFLDHNPGRSVFAPMLENNLDHNPDEVCHMKVPLHTVFKLTPLAYGCRVEKAVLNKDGKLV